MRVCSYKEYGSRVRLLKSPMTYDSGVSVDYYNDSSDWQDENEDDVVLLSNVASF